MQIFFVLFRALSVRHTPTTAPKSKRRGPAWAVAPVAVRGPDRDGSRPRESTKSPCAATRLTCRLNENYSFLEDQHDHGSATRNGKAKAIGRSPPRFM